MSSGLRRRTVSADTDTATPTHAYLGPGTTLETERWKAKKRLQTFFPRPTVIHHHEAGPGQCADQRHEQLDVIWSVTTWVGTKP